MSNSLFTCRGISEEDNSLSVTINKRNLDTNTLKRTWTAKIDCSSQISLLVTTKFIALTTERSEIIYIYNCNVFSNKSVQILSHNRVYHYAVFDEYLVSLTDNSFKVWDLCSNDVIQSVYNSKCIKHYQNDWDSVGFENYTVVVANRKECLQF